MCHDLSFKTTDVLNRRLKKAINCFVVVWNEQLCEYSTVSFAQWKFEVRKSIICRLVSISLTHKLCLHIGVAVRVELAAIRL